MIVQQSFSYIRFQQWPVLFDITSMFFPARFRIVKYSFSGKQTIFPRNLLVGLNGSDSALRTNLSYGSFFSVFSKTYTQISAICSSLSCIPSLNQLISIWKKAASEASLMYFVSVSVAGQRSSEMDLPEKSSRCNIPA